MKSSTRSFRTRTSPSGPHRPGRLRQAPTAGGRRLITGRCRRHCRRRPNSRWPHGSTEPRHPSFDVPSRGRTCCLGASHKYKPDDKPKCRRGRRLTNHPAFSACTRNLNPSHTSMQFSFYRTPARSGQHSRPECHRPVASSCWPRSHVRGCAKRHRSLAAPGPIGDVQNPRVLPDSSATADKEHLLRPAGLD